MSAIASPEHKAAAAKIRELMAKYKEIEFLVRVGEYKAGVDPKSDEAIAKMDAINQFLIQAPDEHVNLPEAVNYMLQIANA